VGETFIHDQLNRGFSLTVQKCVELAVNLDYTIKGKFAPREANNVVHVSSNDNVSGSVVPRNLLNVLLLD
jgi:hypothetical protein